MGTPQFTYTAEEWKNWTLIVSLYAMKDVIPEQDFRCWQTFVLACRTICKPFVLSEGSLGTLWV